MIADKTALMLRDGLSDTFAGCSDYNTRELAAGGHTVYLAYLGGFTSRDYISKNIITPLLGGGDTLTAEELSSCLCASEVQELTDADMMRVKLLSGAAVVFCDANGGTAAYACMARSDPSRAVSEPDAEIVVRGPREGFVESAETNVALLRKRLRTEKMKVESITLGTYSATTVRIVYLAGVADAALIEAVKARLGTIRLPSVMDSGYIEQYLTGKGHLFTEVGNSEKPDKVAAKLTEGRAAIICDGSPVVLTVPYLFIESLQSAEDYLKTPYYATFIRIIRSVCLLIALYLPALYIAVTEHHKGAVPYALYGKIVSSRENVPFGLFGELIVILLIFEIIREVGVRMPGAVGDAVSIVAGLVLGDAAVSAGISSAPVIMVASLTAICTFISPPFMNSTVLVRLINTLLAKALGMVGIAVSVCAFVTVLCCKTSFGVPYLLPLAPPDVKGWNDVLYANPRSALEHAPDELKLGRNA